MAPIAPVRRAPYRYFGALRLVLASLVVLQHADALLPARFGDALRPYEVGGIAVYAFFVLSGFVIAEAVTAFYLDRPVAFLCNRLIRLLPAYAIAVVATAAVVSLAGSKVAPAPGGAALVPESVSVRTVALNVFALFPVWRPIAAHLQVPEILDLGWTLRVEWLFYLLVAAAVVAAGVVRISLAAALSVCGLGLLLAIAALGRRVDDTFLENAPYFIVGVAAFFAVESSRTRWSSTAFGLTAVVVAVTHLLGRSATFGPGALPRDPAGEALLLLGLVAIILVLAVIPGSGHRAAGWKRADRFCGDLTYPLYVTHAAVLIAAQTWLPNHAARSALLAFLAADAVAALTAVLVEKPVAELRARVRGRALAAPASGGAPGSASAAPLPR